jgi:hypothetical protein
VALGISPQVVWSHINDASLVNVTWRDMSSVDEVSQPLGAIGVDFVVVGFRHTARLSAFCAGPTSLCPTPANSACAG